MPTPVLIVFDLDDTLYLERDFGRSGFAAAGEWLFRQVGVPGLGEVCVDLFEAGVRGRVFDEALVRLGLGPDPALLAQLVAIYRSHDPKIELAPDAVRYLARRDGSVPMALITDGPAATQQAKVRALGLEARLGCIVCTDTLGPGRGKPHPLGFERVEAWAPPGLPLAYVADNPLKDFVTPRARGWWTVQIERPERVHRVEAPNPAHEAHGRIASLDELDDCLERLLEAAGGPVRTFPTDTSGRIAVS
ncbi:haloacid dehalogenase [Kaistia sp. 32K]|uniref:HAD family hydrolase n=1 Tax=Kaistia sp. 32K TaxID=2795690 RepID=UPI001916C143|nr:HAD family hydrolase [Kaistia sp. 32K]BCP53910.1 haloacid dehalogenase [Kaistia sp. 32K]